MTKNNNRAWSEKEASYLKELCLLPLSGPDIAIKINKKFWQGRNIRTGGSINSFCERNAVKRMGPRRGFKPWEPTKEILAEINKLISDGKNVTQISLIIAPKVGMRPKGLVSHISEIGKGRFFNPHIATKRNFTALQLEKILGQQNSGVLIRDLANENDISVSGMKSLIGNWKGTRTRIIKDIKAGNPVDQICRKYVLTKQELEMFMSLSEKTGTWNDSETWSTKNGVEILDLIEKASKQFKSVNIRQSESLIRVQTDTKFIGLLLSSDWHIGAASSDIERLREDLEIAASTPNLYIGLQGDLIDAYIPAGPHPGGINEQVVPAKMARRGAEAMIEMIKEKTLWLTNSCHNVWTENAADYNHAEELCHTHGFSYLGHGAIVNLQMIQKKDITRTWIICAGHKYGGGGQNAINACRTFLQKEDPSPDIVVFGHHHKNSILSEEFMGKKRVFVRSGQYKGQDRYADAMNVNSQKKDFGAPMIILGTDSDYMQPFNDMRKGVEVLGLLNKGSRAK